MRFAELNLIRFGQFEGCDLKFPASASDLQVIWGPNEAGKSTTMEAVSNLLFGIPMRTPYDFVHSKPMLRVGAVIETADGPFTCQRRKGEGRTLLGPDETPIDETRLTSLLAGQTSSSFERVFSLDHDRLRQGGEAILKAEGDVGQTIFAAGSGLLGVVRLAKTIDDEASAIWTSRANANKAYHAAAGVYEAARQRLGGAQVKAKVWSERRRALDEAEAEAARLRGERERLLAEHRQVELRRRLLPQVTRRQQLLSELAPLADAPDLPANAAAILASATQEILQTTASLTAEREQRGRSEAELAEISFDPAILARLEEIARLPKLKGAVDKAASDTPTLNGRRQGALKRLAALQAEVGWIVEPAAETRARLPSRPAMDEVRGLLEARNGLDSDQKSTRDELAAQDDALLALDADIGALPSENDGRALAAALRLARAQGDLDGAMTAAAGKVQRERAKLQAALGALAPWTGDVETLSSLTLADEAETARLAQALTRADEDLQAERRTSTDVQEELERLRLERTQLVTREHPVSGEMVATARKARDEVWVGLRTALTGEAALAEPAAETSAFEAALGQADQLADRRFDGAQSSARLATIDQDLERVSLAIAQAETRQGGAEARLAQAASQWLAATRSIGEIAPAELAAWRARRVRALEVATGLAAEGDAAHQLDARTSQLRAELIKTLPAAVISALGEGASLGLLLQAAEQVEGEAAALAQRRTELAARKAAAQSAQTRARSRLKLAEEALAGWELRWAVAVTACALDPAASTVVVRGRLGLLDELRELAGEIVSYETRLADMKADAEVFDRQVRSLAEACAVAHAGLAADRVMDELQRVADQAGRLAQQAGELRRQADEARDREGHAERRIAEATASLEPLLKSAQVTDREKLPAILEQAATARSRRAAVEALEGEMTLMGGGPTPAELVADCEGAEPLALAARADGLAEQLADLNGEIERVAGQRQGAKIAFDAVGDGSEAAFALADMAQARAEMEAHAEAYILKRAEASLLKWAIDRYRQEKQAPLLVRASEIFAKLTLGRYTSLLVDLEGGKPQLSAVKAGASRLTPATGLSVGTRDQLFLALRLAAVEESIAGGCNLPFLADDLFVNFDDKRSAAGFQVLAELATKTQVLFFTHHEHLMTVARKALHPINVSMCNIGE
jgi:uncharacterized protein YhaN